MVPKMDYWEAAVTCACVQHFMGTSLWNGVSLVNRSATCASLAVVQNAA